MTKPKDNTVAAFTVAYRHEDESGIPEQYRVTGPKIALKTTTFGTLYQMGHRAFSFTPGSLRVLKRLQQKGELTWLKTPQSHYHVWHICVCPECCPEILGGTYGARSGGKIWDHSQASHDEHLRYVDPDDLGTFPTVEET